MPSTSSSRKRSISESWSTVHTQISKPAACSRWTSSRLTSRRWQETSCAPWAASSAGARHAYQRRCSGRAGARPDAARHRQARADAGLGAVDAGEHRPVAARAGDAPGQARRAHERDQLALDAARLEIQVERRRRSGREREHVGEQRRVGRVGAIVVRHEHPVAPAPHVDLEDVRPSLDRSREGLEAVVRRPTAVAAVGDAERLGARLQRNEDQGSSEATSTSS